MNSAAIKALLEDLRAIKERAVRHSTGIVASASPLTVVVGGSSVATTMRAIDGLRLSSGDVVSVLTWGNDPGLVIGRVAANTGIVRGTVSGAGAVVAGSGFTAAKLATGLYAITFTAPFAAAPIVLLTPWSSVNARLNAKALGSFSCVMEDAATAGVDAQFEFAALPV